MPQPRRSWTTSAGQIFLGGVEQRGEAIDIGLVVFFRTGAIVTSASLGIGTRWP